MKKIPVLILLTLWLSSCGGTKSPPADPYQVKANALRTQNTDMVVNTEVYLDRVDVILESSTANTYLEKGADYLDDSQFALLDIVPDLDLHNDMESLSVEFPGAKNLQVKPSTATGGGGGSVMAAVTWSAEFVTPPKQWQVVDLVVRIKFKQFDKPIAFEFTKIADVAPDLQ